MFNYGTVQSDFTLGPELRLQASSPVDTSIMSEVDAIVDTGAEMTCVPIKLIKDLGEDTLDYTEMEVRNATGKVETVRFYILHVRLYKCDFPDLEVAALDKEYALIGRDILNQFKIEFDAPKGKWTVYTQC